MHSVNIETIIYNLPRWFRVDPKMEITLDLLEKYNSRSQESYPYSAEDNLKQIISIVGIELLHFKLKKCPYTRFITFRITPTRVNSAKRA